MLRSITALALLLLVAGCATTEETRTEPTSVVYPLPGDPPVKDLDFIKSVLPAGNRRTLVVFDIDDTLLTSVEFFGSDHWYSWQREVAKSYKPNGPLPTDYVPCTYDVNALSHEFGPQQETQEDANDVFNSVQPDKIILTSRNPATRGATIRELTRNAYTLPPQLDGGQGRIYISGVNNKPVSYDTGVFMGNGQDKGKLLFELLGMLGIKDRYDRVVLIDDGSRNITNMQAAAQTNGYGYIGVHYTLVEKPLTPVPEDKLLSARAWKDMSAVWKNNFPARFTEIQNGQCAYGGIIEDEWKKQPEPTE